MHTLATVAQFERTLKKSRFVAAAGPCPDASQAMRFVEEHAEPGYRHVCWAWRIGGRYRFCDAGEPAGTAGQPILGAIDGQGLDRVVVVVSRHFGGIKLGAGGLVRAYGGTAAECLRQAPRILLVETAELAFSAPFDDLGSVYLVVDQAGAERLGEDYAPGRVHLTVRIARSRLREFRERLREATRGRVAFPAG